MSAPNLPPQYRAYRGLLLLLVLVSSAAFAYGVFRLAPGAWPWLLSLAQRVRDTWTSWGWHLL